MSADGLPPCTLELSRDGELAAWRNAEHVALRKVSGGGVSLPYTGPFAFVRSELWAADGAEIHAWSCAGTARIVASDLPGTRTGGLHASPGFEGVVVARGVHTLLLAERRIIDISAIWRSPDLVLSLPGGRVVLIARTEMITFDRYQQQVTRRRLPDSAIPEHGVSILNGKAVALGWRTEDRGLLYVMTPECHLIHRIEVDRWQHCAIAESVGVALVIGTQTASIVDLRFGRVTSTIPFKRELTALAVDAAFRRIAGLIDRDEQQLELFDPTSLEPPAQAMGVAHAAVSESTEDVVASTGEYALRQQHSPSQRADDFDRDDDADPDENSDESQRREHSGTYSRANGRANGATSSYEDEDEDDEHEGGTANFGTPERRFPRGGEEGTASITPRLSPAAQAEQAALAEQPAVQAWVHQLVERPSAQAAQAPRLDTVISYSDHGALIDDVAYRIRLLLARYLVMHSTWLVDSTGVRNDRLVSAREVQEFLLRTTHALGSAAGIEAELEGHWIRVRERLHSGAGSLLPLRGLWSRARLSDEAVDCLCALFLAESDLAFQRVFAYAWSDFTRKQATLGFLAELVGISTARRVRVLEEFEPTAPLVRLGLVHVGGDPDASLLNRTVRLSQRVAWFLLRGSEWLLDHPTSILRSERPTLHLKDLVLDAAAARSISRIQSAMLAQRTAVRYQVTGPAGTGRRSLVRALAADWSRSTTTLTLTPELLAQVTPRRAAATLVAENTMLGSWACVIADRIADPLTKRGAQEKEWLDTFYTAVAENVDAVFMVAPQLIPLPDLDAPATPIFMPHPSAQTQRALWELAAKRKSTVFPSGLDPTALSQYVSLAPGPIFAAVDRAVGNMIASGASAAELEPAVLVRSIRQELASRMGHIATRIERRATLKDVVLPRRTHSKIRELIAFARNRKHVMQEWRLTERFAYGTSVSALFSGPPGTGKTMVAGVIANALGLELFQIDLSRVLSKWIGETERNLEQLFDEAERSQAILLFDEADSLFAKRTQVTSVQDRYANIETNYLLQRIESYEGIAILTTNFETAIDEAFLRRIRFRVRFEVPDRRERKRIWKVALPPAAPCDEEIDFDTLAASYELAGGLIKNAVLRACVAAAELRKGLTTRLLAACAELELAETGRLVPERYRSALDALEIE